MNEYYRVRAEISEKALRANFREIRKKLDPSVLVLSVVKADAYGHGADLVAPLLEKEGSDYFAVATAEEGVSLRKIGISRPILVLGYTDPSEFELLLENQLTAAMFHADDARALSALAISRKSRAKVHLKIETGMGRIGLSCSREGFAEAIEIAQLPGLEVEGIFTHFARADEADKTPAVIQNERFNEFCEELEEQGIAIPIRHCANSASIMEFPEAAAPGDGFTRMVRAGIMLYGLYPSHEMKRPPKRGAMRLCPVMSLKSHVVHLKTVPAGTPIGYGGTFVTERESVIATVPVGYADGYNRALSNAGFAVIDGMRVPVVGRVCMDQLMLDVTELSGVERGDEVTLMGEGYGAEEMADTVGTIHYELTCQFSPRVKRVLVK